MSYVYTYLGYVEEAGTETWRFVENDNCMYLSGYVYNRSYP